MKIDVFSEFSYDPKTKRYRIVDGASKGRFISKTAFLTKTENHIDSQKSFLESLAEKFFQGMSHRQFQIQASKAIRDLHTSQAFLGADGVENFTPDRYDVLTKRIKEQLYGGKNYGIKKLTDKLIKGELSEGQLKTSLRKYANKSKVSFWEQIRINNKDKPYAVRSLGSAEHCPECIEYSKRGIRQRGDLPLPTEACSCGSNCKCTIRYLTLEQVINASAN